MNELTAIANVVLANTFVMYFKTQSYHWNVEGKNFSEYHSFFGSLYEELHGSIDTTAEEIRALDSYAPVSLDELFKYKTIDEDLTKPTYAAEMFMNLIKANDEVVVSLNRLFQSANAANNQGLADYAAGRLNVHSKHAWQLRSYLKSGD